MRRRWWRTCWTAGASETVTDMRPTPRSWVRPTVTPAIGKLRRRRRLMIRSTAPGRSTKWTVRTVSVIDRLRLLDHLGDRLTRRDHGVDVALAFDGNVDDDAAGGGRGPGEGILDFGGAIDLEGAVTVCPGQEEVIRAADRRFGVAAAVEELLPLANHAEVAVVQDDDLEIETEIGDGGELLDVHLDAAVAGHDPDITFRRADLHAHRGGKGESHSPETTGGDVGIGVVVAVELSGPHLVLPDVGDECRTAGGHALDRGEDTGRCGDRRGGGCDRAPPGVDALAPVTVVSGRDPGGKTVHHLPRIALDGDLSRNNFFQLGSVDIDVNDLSVRRELGDFAGYPVVEAHADGQNDVGFVDRAVGPAMAVHAGHAEGERMCLGEGAETKEGRRDGSVDSLGEETERRIGSGEND